MCYNKYIMDEKELKTSLRQRIIISAIAIVMVGTFVASYALSVIGSAKNNNTTSSEISPEKIAKYESTYLEEVENFKKVSAADFNKFVAYKSNVAAYNEASANENGLKSRDLLVGNGRTLEEEDTNYLAYYIGWCADETIFDSSFDDATNPTALVKALDASIGMIEGWNLGVVGMKLGGVRELTIPGELAYGGQREICGGYEKPLKFLVLAVENADPLKSAVDKLGLAYEKLQYAYYGIDYDEEF